MSEPQQYPDAVADADARHHEYSQFRALVPIFHDGARAYSPGHPVPAGNVEKYGYEADGLVERVTPTADGEARPQHAAPDEQPVVAASPVSPETSDTAPSGPVDNTPGA